MILVLIPFLKRLSRVSSWLLGKWDLSSLLKADLDVRFHRSQLGSILSIIILPYFTRSLSPHQEAIQTCTGLDQTLNDIRDYSSRNLTFERVNGSIETFLFLAPVYILSIFSVILVLCFIQFFHCEYRRQRKVAVEESPVVINTSPESTWTQRVQWLYKVSSFFLFAPGHRKT